jgi:hypothetical protein
LLPIQSDDKWMLWAVISVAALVGIKSEDSAVGKALSGAVVSMLVTATLVAVGVLPSCSSAAVTGLQSLVVALATPLLLLSANLTVILRRTGRMLGSFLCGALGTTVGAVLGFWLLRGPLSASLGASGWQICAALAAKNIGGGLNFMGVVEAFDIDKLVVTSALAVDNLLGLLYFPLCGYLCNFVPPAEIKEKSQSGRVGRDSGAGGAQEVGGGVGSGEGGRDIRRIKEGSEGEVREAAMREVAGRGAEGREVVRVHDLNSLAGAVCAGTVIAAAAAKIGSACALAPQTVAVVLAGRAFIAP